MNRSRERRQELFDAVERQTELPMLVLAILFIPVLLIPLIFDLPEAWDAGFTAVNLLIWVAFALELTIKTYLSVDRFRYLRTHWFDVLIVCVPFFRPMRAARALRALRVLKVGAIATRAAHSLRGVLQHNNLHFVLGVSILLVIACGAAMTILERHHADGNIKNLADGLWWAATTVTTVGYGDRFPVTPEGRAIATFLMLLGISLFSFITASIAAFLSNAAKADEPTLQEVMEKLTQLEALLQERNATS